MRTKLVDFSLTTMNNVFTSSMIYIPISEHFREFALKFAREQPTTSAQRRVYLNTLAVQVVNYYLQLLEVETDLEAGDSWNAVTRLIDDVADLVIPNYGKLECRVVTGDDSPLVTVPPETWENRIGYVFVKMDQPYLEAQIIGFLGHVEELEVDINQLQPLEDLIKYLYIIHLRQWLEGIYTQEWLSVEELSRQHRGELAFRHKRVRGFDLDSATKAWNSIEQIYPQSKWDHILPADLLKQVEFVQNQKHNLSESAQNLIISEVIVNLLNHIQEDEEARWNLAEILWTINPEHPAIKARRIMDLGLQIANYPVALMVAILPKYNNSVSVLLRVYPTGNQTYLPTGLKLACLDQSGKALLEVEASPHKDDYIQLKFGAEFNERFRVRIGINDFSITENFII